MHRLVTKFEKYRSVSDLPRSGRGNNVNDDDVEAVLEAMNQLKPQGVLPSTSNISIFQQDGAQSHTSNLSLDSL